MTSTYRETVQAYKKNDPPVEVNQIWIGLNEDRTKILRKIRILAVFPDGIDNRRAWIYMEQPGGMFRTDNGRLGICPEFNLRYVFELEDG